MKKLMSTVLFVVIVLTSFAFSGQDQVNYRAQLRERVITALAEQFKNDLPARVFQNARGLSDRAAILFVLGQPVNKVPVGDMEIWEYPKDVLRNVFQRTSGTQRSPDGIEFYKTDYRLAHDEKDFRPSFIADFRAALAKT